MYRRTLFSAVTAGALLVLMVPGAEAQQAIMPAQTGIDANTFIVGHPASPRWKIVHANGEHPAVLQARHAAGHANAIDPNTFLVQPPAAVHWLASGETPAATVVAKVQ
jgi:hypothetical protein